MVFTDIHTHRFASDDPHAGTADGWKIRECTSCHFVQVSPKPSESDVVSLYHEDWEHFSPYISQTAIHRNYFNAVLDRIEQLKREGRRQKTENGRSKSENRKHQSSVLSPQSSQLLSGLRLLDIGCATGILLEEAEKRGMNATGIDLSRDAVTACKKKKLTAIFGRVTDYVKKAKHSSYDVIVASQVIEHEYEPIAMLRAIRLLLRPGGMALVMTPGFETPYRIIMGSGWVGYKHPEHLWFFSSGTLSHMMRYVGFGAITVSRDIPRRYELSYAFRRLGEYNPSWGWLFGPLYRLSHVLHLTNPINPWGDIMAIAWK